jgi:RNA polymerase sigma-70 factor (ECF subfamily)
LESRLPARRQTDLSDRHADLVRKYTRAWHAADLTALVELLRADADMAMPPTPSWYHGRDAIGTYLRRLFAEPWGRDLRLLPTAANLQPASPSTPRRPRIRRHMGRSRSRCSLWTMG